MSPLKLIIPGRYWDSQIYRGRLYLFGMDGDILTLDWDRLIENLPVGDDLRLPVRSAFRRSDFLYGVAATGILDDPEFKDIMRRRFRILSEAPIELSRREIETTTLGRQANRFPFPHSDSEIYHRHLYVSSRSGVSVASCGSTKYPISTHVRLLSEMPVSAVRASYRTLALAAGEEGLWQYSLDDFADRSHPERVASHHCNECHWAFYSIYGSSSEFSTRQGRTRVWMKPVSCGGMALAQRSAFPWCRELVSELDRESREHPVLRGRLVR